MDALIKQGQDVIVLDNLSTGRLQNLEHTLDRIQFIECDISQKGKWQDYFKDVDLVFHLAALADIVPSIENPTKYHKANVEGTVAVLEAARLASVRRFIYAASSSCYGLADQFPTPETAPIKPMYPYALTKNVGEQYVMHWAQLYKMPCVSLRLFNVYGPRSRTAGSYGAVFGVFLAQLLASKPFTVVGDGNQTRDFTFVTDVVEAFVLAAESDLAAEIFNVGSGNTYSVNKLVGLLRNDAGVVYLPKRPGEPDCTQADVSRISDLLEWSAKISLEEGVSRLMQDMDRWRSAPVWDEVSIGSATREWFRYLS